MRRRPDRFLLVLVAVLALAWSYLALRLDVGVAGGLLLAVPFVLAGVLPAVYWRGLRESQNQLDDAIHVAAYLSMGWLNFALLLALLRDALLLIAALLSGSHPLSEALAGPIGATLVWSGSLLALAAGFVVAASGPRLREVEVPIADLHPDLDGLRILQISDLHVGSTLGLRYVRRVVKKAAALAPDLVVYTGDIIDGPVARLETAVAPLASLGAPGQRFLVLGNHEYYAGAAEWVRHFRALGFTVLLNEAQLLTRGGARLLVGGVTDPAAPRLGSPGPDAAAAAGGGIAADLRLLLAHHPGLAPAAAAAGFDLQLSGHTHGGQFFPWTLAVRYIHAPHVTGLSRRERMWVYVSAGTGSWGPPIRFGTEPELSLIRLRRRPADAGTP